MKGMNHIGQSRFLLCALSLVLLVACSGKDDQEVTFLVTNVNELVFENGGGSQKFTIESNSDWDIVISEEWMTANPLKGSGNQEIIVTVANLINPVAVSGTIVIRTADGSKIRNVEVTIKGNIPNYPNEGDKVLQVTNTVNMLNFAGIEHDLDSLVIYSNIAWEIKGPDWIEAWDGKAWRPLSLEFGRIYGTGPKAVLIRTVREYNEVAVRESELEISERLTGKMPVKILVSQAGKHIVLENKILALATGVGMNWKCGSGVSSFYYCVSEKQIPQSAVNKTEVTQNWRLAMPGSGCAWSNLKENTMYYITTVSSESLEAGTNLLYYVMFYTPTSAGQPKVDIKDIILYENIWHAQTEMDDNTYAYLAIGADESAFFFDYSPALLAFTIWTQILNNPYALPVYNTSGYAPLCYYNASASKIRATTWGMADNGRFSSIITTKQRTYSQANGANEVKQANTELELLKDCLTETEFQRLKNYLMHNIVFVRK